MSKMKHWSLVTVALATCFACGLADIAFAKQGRGRGRGRNGNGQSSSGGRHGGSGGGASRVNERISLAVVDTTQVAPRKARLRIRRKKASRSELRLQVQDASPGFDLDVWFEDGAGAMVRVGALRESDDNDGDTSYSWRVRTQKGQALPFGVSDVADLSGRDFEVRRASDVVVQGTMPSLTAAPASVGKRADLRNPLSSSFPPAANSNDAVKAEIRVRRKRGDEQLKVEVEHLESGLALSLWIADTSGLMQRVADLAEESAGEYEVEIESEHEALPLGVDSLSELADRAIEVRTDTGEVVADGFVPRLGDESTSSASSGESDDDDDSADDHDGDDDDDSADDHDGDDSADDHDGDDDDDSADDDDADDDDDSADDDDDDSTDD